MTLRQTDWRVITGPPSSGKTSLIRHLASLGHRTRPEGATRCIERMLATGRPLSDICAVGNQAALQLAIALLNAEQEAEVAHEPDVPYVLDRSLIDTIAYCRLYGQPDRDAEDHMRHRYHPVVILLEPRPMTANHVRCESDDTAARLALLYEQVYTERGYTVVKVPAPVHPDPDEHQDVRISWSVARRAELVLRHWNV